MIWKLIRAVFKEQCNNNVNLQPKSKKKIYLGRKWHRSTYTNTEWMLFSPPYITDGNLKAWGKTELETCHSSIGIICWDCMNTMLLHMCYFRTLRTWFSVFHCPSTMYPRARREKEEIYSTGKRQWLKNNEYLRNIYKCNTSYYGYFIGVYYTWGFFPYYELLCCSLESLMKMMVKLYL